MVGAFAEVTVAIGLEYTSVARAGVAGIAVAPSGAKRFEKSDYRHGFLHPHTADCFEDDV